MQNKAQGLCPQVGGLGCCQNPMAMGNRVNKMNDTIIYWSELDE